MGNRKEPSHEPSRTTPPADPVGPDPPLLMDHYLRRVTHGVQRLLFVLSLRQMSRERASAEALAGGFPPAVGRLTGGLITRRCQVKLEKESSQAPGSPPNPLHGVKGRSSDRPIQKAEKTKRKEPTKGVDDDQFWVEFC